MILTKSQLAHIRAASFDFNEGFLGRLAEGMDDFLKADGMLSAEESPGPLTEIAENHALLLEVLDRAKCLTTEADQSRADGISRLTALVRRLEGFCFRKHGTTVAALIVLRATPDKYDAVFLNRVADTMKEYIRARAALVAKGEATVLGDEREVYDTTTEAIEYALASPLHDDPAKAEAIERLQALRDELRELF